MSLGNKMLTGAVWSTLERLGIQAISFVLGIVLARLLSPEEYGTVGLLIVFITVSQVFIDSGFAKALIHKQERTQADFSTVFFFNTAIAILCYVALFFAAPFVRDFYEIPELTLLLRVLSISLIFNALYSIPSTILTIKMDFKSMAKVNITATLLSGISAICFAILGFGVWALILQTLLRSFLLMIGMFFLVKWRPIQVFDRNAFKELFSYGSKLLISSLLGTLLSNLNALLIAKYIGTKELGNYSRGVQFSDLVYTIFSSVLNSVLLPGLSTIQDKIAELKASARNITRTAAVFIVPIFAILAILAKPIILVLLTAKWELAIPIMQIFCISRMITVLSGINVNLLYVLGRTDLALRQQYFNIFVRVIFLLIALPHGIIAIAWAELASTTIHFFVNSYFPGKIIGYGATKQIRDILPICASTLGACTATYLLMIWIDNNLFEFLVLPFVSVGVYFTLIHFLGIKEHRVLFKRLMQLRKNNAS